MTNTSTSQPEFQLGSIQWYRQAVPAKLRLSASHVDFLQDKHERHDHPADRRPADTDVQPPLGVCLNGPIDA